jgi:allantoin racemase
MSEVSTVTRVLYINPVRDDDVDERALLQEAAGEKTNIVYRSLGGGPDHLQFGFQRALVIPRIMQMIRQAEAERFDAAIVGCFLDPGVEEGRGLVTRTLVIGPGEASLHLAATLGARFSVLTTCTTYIPEVRRLLANQGLATRLASIHSFGVDVPDLQLDREKTVSRLLSAARDGLDAGAEVLVVGCTGAHGFHEVLQSALHLPVIEPGIAALKFAELAVELRDRFGWQYSKIGGYTTPAPEEILRSGLDSYRF